MPPAHEVTARQRLPWPLHLRLWQYIAPALQSGQHLLLVFAAAPLWVYVAPVPVRHTGAFGSVLRACFCSQDIHQWRRGVPRAGSPAPAVIAALAASVHYSASAPAALAGTSSCGDRSTSSRGGVHRTGFCNRVHRASACRVGVASASGREHRASVSLMMRGTGFIWPASVAEYIAPASGVVATSAPVVEYVAPAPSLPRRDARPARCTAPAPAANYISQCLL